MAGSCKALIGRPPRFTIATGLCRNDKCDRPFFWKRYRNEAARKFCSRECVWATRPAKGQPRKLPPTAEVLRLYFEEMRSTVWIGRKYGTSFGNVAACIERAGRKLRPVGTHAVPKTCKIEDCQNPPHRMIHATNGVEYGTLCLKHRTEHYRRLNREQRRRKRNIDPERQEPWRTKEPENQEYHDLQRAKKVLRSARSLISKLESGNGQQATTEDAG